MNQNLDSLDNTAQAYRLERKTIATKQNLVAEKCLQTFYGQLPIQD